MTYYSYSALCQVNTNLLSCTDFVPVNFEKLDPSRFHSHWFNHFHYDSVFNEFNWSLLLLYRLIVICGNFFADTQMDVLCKFSYFLLNIVP